MKKLLLSVIMLFVIGTAISQVKTEKINISYWYVFGRFPSAAEMNYWNSQPEYSLDSYVKNHQNYLQSDNKSIIEAIQNSYKDAFGRGPNQGEIDYWSKGKRIYGDLVTQHVIYLRNDPAENRATINRAYQSVYGRQATAEELTEWSKGNCSYVILTACLQSYKTSGTYRLQSAEGIVNFLRGAWETSANFVVNSGKAVYNATASAITAVSVATQKVFFMTISNPVFDEISRALPGVVGLTENKKRCMAAGLSEMKMVSNLINLDGAGLIGAGGLN